MAFDTSAVSYGSWPIKDIADVSELGYTRFISQKFVDALQVKAMQTESELERLLMREEIDGNPMMIDALKPLSATDPAGELTTNRDRFAALAQKIIPTEQRQMAPNFYDYMFYVDPRDQAAMHRKLDPTGQMLNAVLGAFSIRKDKQIIAALDGDVAVYDADDQQYTPGTALTFTQDGGTDIGVADVGLTRSTSGGMVKHDGFSATTGETGEVIHGLGLNVGKLIEARKTLQVNYGMNSGARPILVCHPIQLHQMLASSEQVQSADYNAVKPLVTGEVTQYLGMDIVTCNDAKVISNIDDVDLGGGAANTDEVIGAGHYAYVFMPDALYYGCSGVNTKTDILPEKGHTLQVASYMHCGAVRLDGKKIVRIVCADEDTKALA